MANGILGSADLAATTYTGVYLVPENTFAVATVNIVNKNTSSITVRLAIAKTDPTGATTPVGDDYLEYDTEILPNGVLERTGIVMQAGRSIYCYSTQANTDVVVYGIETETT